MYFSVKHKFLLLHVLIIFKVTDSENKSKRNKDFKNNFPTYELYNSDTLPSDVQVTSFLYKEQPKMFFYWSTVHNLPLSATIITCSSKVEWYMAPHQNNETILPQKPSLTSSMETIHFKSLKGLYILNITSVEKDSYIHIYISTEPNGPQAIENSKYQELKLMKRHRRRRLTVRWEPSLVDPQSTEYCLIVSSRGHYGALCGALSDKFGVEFQKNLKLPVSASQTVISYQPNEYFDDHEDPAIICIEKKTQYTLSDLRQGQNYYFDVFALNKQSNLTYPHGKAHMVFDRRTKAITLKDGKSTFTNLRKLDGRAVFKFKVNRRTESSLELFIMPCGGAVDVEVNLKGEVIALKKRIEGFGKVRISSPLVKSRYRIKVYTSNREEFRKTSGVEIYATTKSFSKTPLPSMPNEPIVKEYISLRKCDSVTIGWLSSPDQKSAHYCLVVKEGKIREMENYKMPNQCGLENRLRKSADYTLKYCKDITHEKEQVVTERISHLKPGKNYIIQVTVKKPKGKTLSYDLVQIHTLPFCHKKKFIDQT
ncbi:unnamed protein product [Brassicogethes aeneus]|uniref:Protein NDNF n=1 Tax=Brassicogethes aeneus TaxID=1431903 RepID=A0A9P0BIM7_BRAAE|nr:unnamed protein product [Brassicogethes aeneus]